MMFRIAFLVPVSITGWSGDGHRIIARIASEFLRDSGKYFVAEHLTEGDASKVEKALIDHSIYADTVEWSHDLHFSHTPYRACAPFEMERDCPLVEGAPRCIVTAIANYTMRASDVELSLEDRGEAIKFLIHLVGDIHNPLHVGFAEDFGGNLIHLANPVGKSLHNVWDYTLVNRKQGEHGVFKESEEDDAEPWKLSEALLKEISGLKAAHTYRLKMQGAEAIDIATEMASETALGYTCELAYRDERGQWIGTSTALTEEYLSTRAETAMELLKLSGIRLAEILNHIGKVFSTNKYEVREIAEKAAISPPVDVNPFAVLVLDFEFNPEEHLFDEEKKQPVGEGTIEQTTVAPSPPVLSKSQKNKLRKARAQRIIDSAVLIKRKGYFVVTGAELVTPAYFPYHHVQYRVRFVGDREVQFVLDTSFFGVHIGDSEFIKRALMKIGNVADGSVVSSSKGLSSVEMGKFIVYPFAGQIKVGSMENRIIYAGETSQAVVFHREMSERFIPSIPEDGISKKSAQKRRSKLKQKWKEVLDRIPSNEELLELQAKESYRDICYMHEGPLVLYVHRKTLEDPLAPMIKANMLPMVAPEGFFGIAAYLLIDTNIIDGLPTTTILDLFLDAAKENVDRCTNLLLKRLSLSRELRELSVLMLGESPFRVNQLVALKYFSFFRLEDEYFHRVHWSVHAELDRWSVRPQLEGSPLPEGK